jgi:hypothetical protein
MNQGPKDMLASILIIGFSLVLFVYWFRASCKLLLTSHAEQATVNEASDNRFSFPHVQEVLRTGGELGALDRLLNHDFQVLTYLRLHGANLDAGSFEDHLLIFDYRIMRWYFRLMNRTAPAQARNALSEMATVVGVLAYKMGTQAGV